MSILPEALTECLFVFRPLLRHEVYLTFTYLMTGLLAGEAKGGAVRASVFAPADYQPSRISDFFTTHRVAPQRLMAALAGLVLRRVYGRQLPTRLFWIADSTTTEKPYAERVAGVRWFHRTKRVAGRGKNLKGHCFVCAALLYDYTDQHGQVQWASALVGALLYVKGRSLPLLVGDLAGQLRLPHELRHVWLVDRGLLTRTLLRAGATGARRAGPRQSQSGRVLRAAPSTPARTQESLRREMPRRSLAQAVPATPADDAVYAARARPGA